MSISLTLPQGERLAPHRFANETGEEPDAAAGIAIREFLISVGMLEPGSVGDNEAG